MRIQEDPLIATHCILTIPDDAYHMVLHIHIQEQHLLEVCMGSERGREEFSSGKAVKSFFVLASMTLSSELHYTRLPPLEILHALALVRPVGVGKETQKDAWD